MWPGPYGNWGSRKYLLASLDQSLRRMGFDYVDIFYHRRPDPETPIEETATAVQSGKALYAGISAYSPEETELMAHALAEHNIHQPAYNMCNRQIEHGLLPALEQLSTGAIAFVPLAHGLLTDRYLADEIPAGSRAATSPTLPDSQTPTATSGAPAPSMRSPRSADRPSPSSR